MDANLLDQAIAADDLARVDEILRGQSDVVGMLNAADCGRPRVLRARSLPMAARLVDAGADLDAVGRWWADGFNVNPLVDPTVGHFLIERGAPVSPHAAAAMGLVDVLTR